jgi:hypothetical protein
MSVKLPKQLEQLTLYDLLEGQEVYTIPWALWADQNGDLWLDIRNPYTNELQGTSSMKVTKKDGKYICDITKCGYFRWARNQTYYSNGSVLISNLIY